MFSGLLLTDPNDYDFKSADKLNKNAGNHPTKYINKG